MQPEEEPPRQQRPATRQRTPTRAGPTTDPAPETSPADDAALKGAKTTLRQAVRLRRDSRAEEQRAADDQARLTVLQDALRTRGPDTVAAYLSSGTEPATLQLVAWLAAQEVRVLLPVLSDGSAGRRFEPAWAPYAGPDALRTSPYGILEPTTSPGPAQRLSKADVILCPALAGNRRGHRLGRGGGWYDRALPFAWPQTPVWALLNEDEVLPAIPTQAWDQPVTGLAVPSGLLDC